MQIGQHEYDEATRIAADIITRHSVPMVGYEAAKKSYAVFFSDPEPGVGVSEYIRIVSGFDSPGDAARAIPFIVAATIIETVSVWDADTAMPDA